MDVMGLYLPSNSGSLLYSKRGLGALCVKYKDVLPSRLPARGRFGRKAFLSLASRNTRAGNDDIRVPRAFPLRVKYRAREDFLVCGRVHNDDFRTSRLLLVERVECTGIAPRSERGANPNAS